MPYSLKKSGTGYKVCSPKKCFSKKPLSRPTAMRQLAAIQINSRRGGSDFEGGAGSDDSDSDASDAEKVIEKKIDKKDENALDKLDKKEEKVEIKRKKKSKLRSGLKKVGKLVQGFVHFIDQALEGTIETVANLGSESSSKKKSEVTKLKEAVEERAAKAEIHYAVPLYDVIVKNLYDKLGWMLLAKKLGKFEKVQMYKNEIKDTLESMKNLAPIVSSKEKQALNIHYQRLLVLYEEARVLL